MWWILQFSYFRIFALPVWKRICLSVVTSILLQILHFSALFLCTTIAYAIPRNWIQVHQFEDPVTLRCKLTRTRESLSRNTRVQPGLSRWYNSLMSRLFRGGWRGHGFGRRNSPLWYTFWSFYAFRFPVLVSFCAQAEIFFSDIHPLPIFFQV